MSNSKEQSNIRSTMYNGKSSSVLPPKIPLHGISQPYVDYIPSSSTIGSKPFHNHREYSNHHQRTSSESFLMDEQPSWLDDLLDEPETPVRKGHRRSTSDSFAYLDTNDIGNMSLMARVDRRFENGRTSFLPWGSQHVDGSGDIRHSSAYQESHLSGKTKSSNPWDAPPLGLVTPARVNSSRIDVVNMPNVGQQNTLQYLDKKSPTLAAKHDPAKSGLHDLKNSDERKSSSDLNSSASEADTRRAKQKYAQRSRVRKLQYIAELERNVQALQAEGSEVSAELEFLNQQNLILSMENNALKQRLDNLSQEQLIKHLEHEVLEREVIRLRNLYQQQNQQQQKSSAAAHRRTKSKDLDQQFSNLSLNHIEASPCRDSISSNLHT